MGIIARLVASIAFLVRPSWMYKKIESDAIRNGEIIAEYVRSVIIETENRVSESYEEVIQKILKNPELYM